MSSAKDLPITEHSLVLRTDFSNDVTWRHICAALQAPQGDFGASVDCVSDSAFDGITPTDIVARLPEKWDHSFIFLVDSFAISHPEHAIAVVDLYDEPGRIFRVIPSEAWGVKNNLSLANMDFDEFAGSVDSDGVFRGFGVA